MPQQVEITMVSAASNTRRADAVIRAPRHFRQATKSTTSATSYAIRLGVPKSLIDRPPVLASAIARPTMKITPARMKAKRANWPMRS